MREKRKNGFLLAVACLLLSPCTVSRAEIAGDGAFENLQWQQVHEEERSGVVQSICATEDYIITIENMAEDAVTPDVVSAYYRNDKDENGNAVEPYTLAKRTQDTVWEHGNGMAYNPKTKEIYVALYTHMIPENRGCIYVMDPDTLAYKRTINISGDYNILGIGYMEDKDQYVIQTNVDGGYSFKILDADFQIVEDLGEYADTAEGDNFQDLEVCGDYILNFPLTLGLGIGDYIHAYSIERKEMAAASQLDFAFENITTDEPESLCELEPGTFLAVVNVINTEGTQTVRFYRTEVPYYFQVKLSAENGTVKGKADKVLRGESVSFSYEAGEGYEPEGIKINGKKTVLDKKDKKYTLNNIQSDMDVQVVFQKIPFPVATAVGFGIIAAAAAAAIGIYYRLLQVRRERRRKARQARKRRQQLLRERQEELTV